MNGSTTIMHLVSRCSAVIHAFNYGHITADELTTELDRNSIRIRLAIVQLEREHHA